MRRAARFMLFLLVLALLSVPAIRAQEITSILGDVVSVHLVRFERPERFTAAGGAEHVSRDTILISVEVRRLMPFMHGALLPSLFVVDGVVADTVLSPLEFGNALILALAPEDAATATLTLLPSGLSEADVANIPRGRLEEWLGGFAERRRLVIRDEAPLVFEDRAALRNRLVESGGKLEP
jgi:hypothetical protein